jgi:hypothetical protein
VASLCDAIDKAIEMEASSGDGAGGMWICAQLCDVVCLVNLWSDVPLTGKDLLIPCCEAL